MSTDTVSYTHILTPRSPALYSPTTPRRPHSPTTFSGPIVFLPLPLCTPLAPIPGSDRSARHRNQPSHSTVLALTVCPFVCVSDFSFPCWFSDLGLNFLLASAYCTHEHTRGLDSYSRPTAGKSSSPGGLSTLIYGYVVDEKAPYGLPCGEFVTREFGRSFRFPPGPGCNDRDPRAPLHSTKYKVKATTAGANSNRQYTAKATIDYFYCKKRDRITIQSSSQA